MKSQQNQHLNENASQQNVLAGNALEMAVCSEIFICNLCLVDRTEIHTRELNKKVHQILIHLH